MMKGKPSLRAQAKQPVKQHENKSGFSVALPLPLAGEGWGGGASTKRAVQVDRFSPTRRASRADLPRKRER
jgi:hypothetical protein